MNNVVVALDDGYFPPIKKGKTTIAGILWKDTLIKSVIDLIEIDGLDATQKAIKIINELQACSGESVILLDGIAYAGFNYIDPEEITNACSSNYIVVFYRPLNLGKIKDALLKNFNDW